MSWSQDTDHPPSSGRRRLDAWGGPLTRPEEFVTRLHVGTQTSSCYNFTVYFFSTCQFSLVSFFLFQNGKSWKFLCKKNEKFVRRVLK